MLLVEQAVYTSARTERSAGYQLVAQSSGVCAADARALAVWGPSHDALLETSPDVVSVNFHPLPSGAYCVSRTTAAGWEYSGRGSQRIYTHCLVVPPEVLARFANNALALARAASGAGAMREYENVPRHLEPLAVPGGAPAVDQHLLARLAMPPGPQAMGRLMHVARQSQCLAVAGPPSPAHLIEGLLLCLPPTCRTEFSFTTGLKYSSRRPFRIVALSDDPAQRRWTVHHPNIDVLDLADRADDDTSLWDGWARLIDRAMASGGVFFLADQLAKRRSELACNDLPALGLQLLEDLETRQFETETAADSPADHEDAAPDPDASPPPVPMQRAHAAHCRFDKSGAVAAKKIAAPSQRLHAESPDVIEKLERLDDVVYDAIGGHPAALQRLEALWPQTLAELGDDLVAESREQYLRYALSIWEECASADGLRNPARAIHALDVLCVLFNEA